MTRTQSFVRRGNALSRRYAKRSLNVLAPNPPVQITTLPNKMRVATESTPGHFSSLGLYIDAGSRYESAETSGVSHFLDRMAFKVRAFLESPYPIVYRRHSPQLLFPTPRCRRPYIRWEVK